MYKDQLTTSLEFLIAGLSRLPLLPLFLLFSVIGLVTGIFIATNPVSAMEMQRKFYEKINWKIEPISISKEIRNTRIMGWFLVAILLAILILVLTNKSIFL
mgnify:CR=1 FL=1